MTVVSFSPECWRGERLNSVPECPPENRPAPRISGRVYSQLLPCILVRAYTAVPLDP